MDSEDYHGMKENFMLDNLKTINFMVKVIINGEMVNIMWANGLKANNMEKAKSFKATKLVQVYGNMGNAEKNGQLNMKSQLQ